MRHYPTDESDLEESERLAPEQWMLDTLKLNPSYVSWGPHEDYMWTKDSKGWNSSVIVPGWPEMHFQLDDLNEVVNFYFSISRPSKDCEVCGGKGVHPDAQWVTESWSRHSSPFTKPDFGEMRSKSILEQFGCQFKDGVLGRGTLPPDDVIARYGKAFLEHCQSTIDNGGEWSTAITQDEVQALVDGHRLHEFTSKFIPGEGWKDKGVVPTAAEVNTWAKGRGIGHDSINSWICCEQRCKRLGIPYACPNCGGHGNLFTGPAHLTLTLWILHPRKGCSRGVEVSTIEHSELPAVFTYLTEAAKRNAERFNKIPETY